MTWPLVSWLLSSISPVLLILNLQYLAIYRCLADIQSLRKYSGIMLLLMRTWECGIWRYGRSWFKATARMPGRWSKAAMLGIILFLPCSGISPLIYIAHILHNVFKIWNMNISIYVYMFLKNKWETKPLLYLYFQNVKTFARILAV